MANTTDGKKAEIKKVDISIPQVQAWLKEGIDRDAIGQKLGLNKSDIKDLFMHKNLKGLKVNRPRPKKERPFTIVDEGEPASTKTGTDSEASENGNENGASLEGATQGATAQTQGDWR